MECVSSALVSGSECVSLTGHFTPHNGFINSFFKFVCKGNIAKLDVLKVEQIVDTVNSFSTKYSCILNASVLNKDLTKYFISPWYFYRYSKTIVRCKDFNRLNAQKTFTPIYNSKLYHTNSIFRTPCSMTPLTILKTTDTFKASAH